MTYYQRLIRCLFFACAIGIWAMFIHNYLAIPAALIAFCVAYKLTEKLEDRDGR